MLDNTTHQTSKFGTKNCVEIHDDAYGPYHTNSQIRLKTAMSK